MFWASGGRSWPCECWGIKKFKKYTRKKEDQEAIWMNGLTILFNSWIGPIKPVR